MIFSFRNDVFGVTVETADRRRGAIRTANTIEAADGGHKREFFLDRRLAPVRDVEQTST
jgi:hypothetical protein